MNQEELRQLLLNLLQRLPIGIWHALDDTDEFEPTLKNASNLTSFQLETILLATSIRYYQSGQLRFNLRQLDVTKTVLTPDIDLQITRATIGTKRFTFICNGKPKNQNPSKQLVDADCRLRPRRNNELDRSILDRINRLCEERTAACCDIHRLPLYTPTPEHPFYKTIEYEEVRHILASF
jgi:hypothetical protein